VGFALEHLLFGAFGAFAFLATDFLNSLFSLSAPALHQRLNLVTQLTPCQKSVERLGAVALALYLDPAGLMGQMHAGASFVDLLPPMP
jgi:hypothetical protein